MKLDPIAEAVEAQDICLLSRRVDGPKHSWRWDGDDPRVICAYCDEMRDALSGRLLRAGHTATPDVDGRATAVPALGSRDGER